MIIYKCKCGSEFRAGKKHTSKGKDGVRISTHTWVANRNAKPKELGRMSMVLVGVMD